MPSMWISMKDTIKAYVRGCSMCQRIKPSHTSRNSLLKGPLSDRGTEFVNDTFHARCRELLGSWKVKTTAYHAQTNGLCERLNGTIEKMLRAYIKDTQMDWDTRLPFVMIAYRSAVQDTIRETRYRMTFGHEMLVLLDWIYGNPSEVPKLKINFVRELRDSIEAAFNRARVSLSGTIKRQKRNYDKRVKRRKFIVGDTVMVHDKTRTNGRSPALQAKWKGPFTVTDICLMISLQQYRNLPGQRNTWYI